LGISAFLFWWASRSLEDDLETSRRASAREAAGGSILAAD
jgi:hypothetical protein